MKSRKLPSSTELAALAADLCESPREKANNLPVLISALTSSKHQVLPIIQSLKLYLIGCFARGDLNLTTQDTDTNKLPTEAEAVYSKWLLRQYAALTDTLLALLASGTDGRTQVAAMTLLMECVRGEKLGTFSNELFSKLVTVVLTHQGVSAEAIGSLITKYAGEYADARYFMLRIIHKLSEARAMRPASGSRAAQNLSDDDEDDAQPRPSAKETTTKKNEWGSLSSPHDVARTFYDVLIQLAQQTEAESLEALMSSSWCGASEVGIVTAADDAFGSKQRKKRRLLEQQKQQDTTNNQLIKAKWASIKLQKRAYSEAWLSFLRLPLPEDIYKRVLSQLPTAIIPHLTSPLLLSDFLTYSLDEGGLIGMLALNGIFLLVTQHGFEYPKFYERLYNLLTADAFQAKHRVRFFQLADIFLASGLVPAYSAAAFAKRFARLALTAPPGGALLSIAFIHNIVRRHPACMQLLHRAPLTIESATTNKAKVYQGEDVYDETVSDPGDSRALESSLWELTALRNHSNPLVANFCSVLDKDIGDRKKTAEVDISELLTSSYTSMFKTEVERRLKQAPTAFFKEIPGSLFSGTGDGDTGSLFVGWDVC